MLVICLGLCEVLSQFFQHFPLDSRKGELALKKKKKNLTPERLSVYVSCVPRVLRTCCVSVTVLSGVKEGRRISIVSLFSKICVWLSRLIPIVREQGIY